MTKPRAYVWTALSMMMTGLLALSAIAADKPETPAALDKGSVISAVQAKAMVEKKEARFFDTRSPINFGKGHIPGAALVAYKEKSEFKKDFDSAQDQFDLSKLPSDKSAKIVFYSDGPKGWKSYKAAVVAIKNGYKNVSWLREGYEAWTEKSFPIEQ